MPLLQRPKRTAWTLYVSLSLTAPPPHPSFSLGNIETNASNAVSKWFMQDIGHTGLNNLLVAYEDKGAKAVCTFGFSQGPGHEPILFQGITDVS